MSVRKMFKKGCKTLLVIGLTFSMLTGYLVNLHPVLAKETSSLSDDDFADTTKKRDGKSLDVALKDVGDLKKFNTTPLYDIENNELLLPRLEGYKVEIFGSDNKPTISLDGKVTRPLTTQTVKLLYKLTNNSDGKVTTTETNAVITIPGQELNVTGENKKPEVIPALREWAGGTGKINLTNARIVVGNSQFNKAASTFKNDYEQLTGRNISKINGTKDDLKAGDIFFNSVDDQMLGDEGYYLYAGGENATENYIEIKATHNTGALYGGVSILQMLKQDSGHNEISKGLTKDYPLFEQRGMMFDVARKWVPMSYLQDLAKQMSWYKLNMLSLHLSDCDIWNSLSTVGGTSPEGWFRLESERFPELTSKDHYTKAEFRNYQASSMNLGIDVIPELDTPGHALAYTNAWKGLARPDNQKYLDVTNPKVLENVKALFDEYINGYNGGEATFINQYVNIGTDEYKSGDSKYKEAFRKYCNDLLEYVNSTGKKAVFWGSLLENAGSTEVTTDATMFAWFKGYADAKASLNAGYKIVSMEDNETYIVPGGGYYSNQFGQAERLFNSWLPNNNTGWSSPAPDAHPGVSGGQFAVWNDFHGNGISVNDISYRIQHNLYTVAEKCWAGTQAKNEGRNYAHEKALASQLGDAPNADFLYEVDRTVKDNELVKLDDTLNNQVAKNTGVNLTDSKNITENVTGKNGNALQFNGDESYIKTDLTSVGFDWTTAMWINPANTDKGILMEGKTGVLYLEDGKLKYDIENYTHTFDCNIKVNEWTHIALTGTYEGVSLYVNGKLFDSLIGKPYPNYNTASGCNSWNGSYPVNDKNVRTQRYYETLMLPLETIGSKTNAINAVIDELNIYNKVLSDTQIAQLAGTTAPTEYENLALNKKAEASSFENGSFTADKAVDGDSKTTRWASGYSDNEWFKVDLGKVENINNIKIYWEGAFGKKYNILLSDDDVNYTPVVEETDGSAGLKNYEFEMKSARFIKMQGIKRGNEPYGYSFFEFEVYGDKIKGSEEEYERKNIAIDKKVEVANFNNGSEGARPGSMAVDGDLETRWEFALNKTGANWISIPLTDEEDVNKIVLKQMVWNNGNRIAKIEVKKVVGNEETVLKTIDNFDGGKMDIGQKIAISTIELDKYVKADAIKIYITPKNAGPNDLVNIREIELYGNVAANKEEPTPDEEEHKYVLIPQSTMTASATDEHPNVGVEGLASMAIDGDTNTRWHTNWTNIKPLPQSITLDLNAVKSVAKYTYLPRTDSNNNGTITKYILETSIDGRTFTKVSEGDWASTKDLKVLTFHPTLARYIRLTAKAGIGNYASAAEINVYTSDAYTKDEFKEFVTGIAGINLDNFITNEAKNELINAMNQANEALKVDLTKEQIIVFVNQFIELTNKLIIKATDQEIKTLSDLYDSFKDINKDSYVKESLIQFEKSMENAKNLIENTSDVTVESIDNAMKALNEAHDALIDLTQLRATIEAAQNMIKDIDSTDATKESYAELQLRLTNAKTVEAKENATANNVAIAEYRLIVACEDLKADPTALKTLIDSLDHEDVYTAESWAKIVTVLDSAKELLGKDHLQISELTTQRIALLEAKVALERRMTNEQLNMFNEFIKNSSKLNGEDYTKESWDGYVTLVNEVNDLLKTNLTNVTKEAAAKLLDRIENYVLVKNTDNQSEALEQLSKLINIYKDGEQKYTISSWKVFHVVLQKAQGDFNNETVDTILLMIDELNTSASHLVLRGQTTELESLVKSYQVDQDIYTQESYQKYSDAFNEANKAIQDNSDLSQSQVDTLLNNLRLSYAGLDKKVVVPDPVIEIKYAITEAPKVIVEQGKPVIFTSNAPIEKFKEVLLDGKVVDSSHYTVKEGSTIVIFDAEYIKLLSEGEHVLTIVSTDGKASTIFNVEKAKETAHKTSTGDTTIILPLIMVMVVASCGMYLVRKKNY